VPSRVPGLQFRGGGMQRALTTQAITIASAMISVIQHNIGHRRYIKQHIHQ
jgi:hypothetical protein